MNSVGVFSASESNDVETRSNVSEGSSVEIVETNNLESILIEDSNGASVFTTEKEEIASMSTVENPNALSKTLEDQDVSQPNVIENLNREEPNDPIALDDDPEVVEEVIVQEDSDLEDRRDDEIQYDAAKKTSFAKELELVEKTNATKPSTNADRNAVARSKNHSRTVHGVEGSPNSNHMNFVSVPYDNLKEENQNCFANQDASSDNNDTMSLLMPIGREDRRSSNQSENMEERLNNEERWQQFATDYPWLLYEKSDGNYAYCFFCYQKLSKKPSSIRKHSKSISHKECEESYIAYRRSLSNGEQGDAVFNIKTEYGANMNVAEIKYKRLSEADAFNNFRWSIWLQKHKWLTRVHQSPNMGYCQLCRQQINVEFLYLRERHESSTKHKEAWQKFKTSQPANESQVDESELIESGTVYTNYDMNFYDPNALHERRVSTADFTAECPWFEVVGQDNNTCRCKLCLVTMGASSFRRHLKTKMHVQNLRLHGKQPKEDENETKEILQVIKQEQIIKRDWSIYSKQHPWLVADPKNSAYGYCKYCEKRFMYGFSAVKRQLHENSVLHRICESEAVKAIKSIVKETAQSSNQDNNVNNKDSQDEGVSQEETTPPPPDDENDEDKRWARGSDDWFKQYSWCERYPKNPNYVFCKYCCILLSITISRSKHENCLRHRECERRFLIQNTDTKDLIQKSFNNARPPQHYPWLVPARNGSKQVFCKYCRLRLSYRVSRIQHEHSRRHLEAAKIYFAKKNKKIEPLSPSSAAISVRSESTVSAFEVNSEPSKMQIWKNKFPWVTTKKSETDPNYCYCKWCHQRVFMPTLKYGVKHAKSIRHMRARVFVKRERSVLAASRASDGDQASSTDNENADNNNEEKDSDDTSPKGIDGESWKQLQRKHPWILPDPEQRRHYGFCKYCNHRLMLSGVFRFRHEVTAKHTEAEKKYKAKVEMKKSVKSNDMEFNSSNTENESEEGVNVKPEPRDHNARLRRSKRERSDGENFETPHKRQRMSEAVKRCNRMTAATSEILQLASNCNRHSLPASLFESPVSLAACLAPILRQNITGVQASPPPPTERNSFDLFFESVSTTVKSMPTDLAVEAKMKVMQVISELELRLFNRQNASRSTSVPTDESNQLPPTPPPQPPPPPQPASFESTASANDTSASDGDGSTVLLNGGGNDVEIISSTIPKKKPEYTVRKDYRVPTHQNGAYSHEKRSGLTITFASKKNVSDSQKSAPMAEKQIKPFQLNPTLQVASRTEKPVGIRCVPLKALKQPQTQEVHVTHITTNRLQTATAGGAATETAIKKLETQKATHTAQVQPLNYATTQAQGNSRQQNYMPSSSQVSQSTSGVQSVSKDSLLRAQLSSNPAPIRASTSHINNVARQASSAFNRTQVNLN